MVLSAYFRLLRTTAIVATRAMMTTAAIATYVSTESPPVGFGAGEGVAVPDAVGVGVAAGVSAGDAVVIGAGEGASSTPKAVSSYEGQ